MTLRAGTNSRFHRTCDFITCRVSCVCRSLNSPWRTLVASVATDIEVQVQAVLQVPCCLGRFQFAISNRYQIHSNTTPLTLVVSLVPVWYQHQSIHFSRWVWVVSHAITAISDHSLDIQIFLLPDCPRLPQTALTHGATLVPNGCRTKPARSAKRNLSVRNKVFRSGQSWISGRVPWNVRYADERYPHQMLFVMLFKLQTVPQWLRWGPTGVWVLQSANFTMLAVFNRGSHSSEVLK